MNHAMFEYISYLKLIFTELSNIYIFIWKYLENLGVPISGPISLRLLQLNDLLGWQSVFLHGLCRLQLGFLVILDSILQISLSFSWSAISYQLSAQRYARNYRRFWINVLLKI